MSGMKPIRLNQKPGETTLDAVRRSQSARLSQRKGAQGEDLVKKALVDAGYLMVERICPPAIAKMIRGKPVVVYTGAVSGDYRAIAGIHALGLSVLVEAKTYDERLPWSAFEDHQIEALDLHARCGGISIVAWVDRGEVRLISWFIFREIGFGPGKSVGWDEKEGKLRIHTRDLTSAP